MQSLRILCRNCHVTALACAAILVAIATSSARAQDRARPIFVDGQAQIVPAFEDSAQVTVEIADAGPGIPQQELPHVWEELYRGQGARGVPGSGLGLALARAIAERHGGRVTLRSRAGQGTVVTMRLPAT